MRLERLEIHGFKSFSDRSELAFDKGVTAIVGPNGCGKSNVADAITWVMGEQSAKSLRGERMEDVIFNGSDARKPTAAAEVRLKFSGVLTTLTGPAFPVEPGGGHGNGHGDGGHGNGNGNGHGDGNGLAPAVSGLAPVVSGFSRTDEFIQSVAREVEVTRRLFRSGESEYLIDGETCRLKDIHDLLMDTGLGAKAYAIIEQGKIGMILSSRPTDRRQLIEEAAGVTKYKARRRSAELKLEAAQQNLTRIDDIVFEVDKQRGALKRQAAKARRYQRLRDELRRWEKVLFARRYRELAETIQSARARLADARERETTSAARVAEVENEMGRLRIELVEVESRATAVREAAHGRELAINRRQQQIVFDREQAQGLDTRSRVVASELETIEARREPARAALAARSEAAATANGERDRAAATLASESDAYESAHREIEGFEADVEAARSEVFSAINSATALRHALEHAAVARDRVADTLAKLDVEADDVRIERARADVEHAAAADGLARAHEAIEATRVARAAREAELEAAGTAHESQLRLVRAREHELAGLEARLQSLEEVEAARAAYGDAPRAVLAQANGKVNQQGAVADYLEVEGGYERAVEACLGDLLQYVVVERPEYAEAGFDVVRAAGVGRCGFLIADGPADGPAKAGHDGSVGSVEAPDGVIPLSSIVRVSGPFADPIRAVIGDAWIAESYARAHTASDTTSCPVATMDGDVFRGPRLVAGGGPGDARGILETKREIKELRGRVAADCDNLFRLSVETRALEAAIARASEAIAALDAEHHKQEKSVVAYESRLEHATEETLRHDQKCEQLARERSQAQDERDGLGRRQDEARASIERLETDQRGAEERLTATQRRLFGAREASEDLSRRAAEARAAHAALVERAAALASEVQRLEEASADLQARAASLAAELNEGRRHADALRAAIAAGETELDTDIRSLDALRLEVNAADDAVATLRLRSDEHDAAIKVARGGLELIRATVTDLDIARVTAEADLSHLATSCLETVQESLDEVLAEVQQSPQSSVPSLKSSVMEPDDEMDPTDEGESTGEGPRGTDDVRLGTDDLRLATDDDSAESVIAQFKARIDRLGPVNMMAIEQFDELETRHTFLTTQRADLVDSIAQTSEAITRIDETTRQRFSEAFAAINRNFQEAFSTLFGGGRAGLTLLDETDPLDSGIEIIAQPPGKRLQSVQLLSGGEKALTAIALMFGMFKYKPSPFCLLDEIDAPLDDANIGRFVEMLRSMQQFTQFIVITHNRKTMEIADRLYGVTMEEPGVSKLISVQLN